MKTAERANRSKILITGCSGYVGRQLAALLSAKGYDVTGTCRSDFDLDGIDVRRGVLTNSEFVTDILSDRDIVIHAAALTRSKDPAELRESNESVTSLLLDGVASSSVKRVIFLSTDQAVNGVGPYGESKQNCETIVREKAKDYAILRLTPVIGEFAPTQNSTFSKVISKILNGSIFVMPGDGDFPIAPIGIKDIAKAIDLLIMKEDHLDKTYGLCGEPSTFLSFVNQVEETVGLRRWKVPLPIGPIKKAAGLLKRLPGSGKLPLDSILNIGQPIPVDTQDLGRDTGFKPTPLSEIIGSMPGLPVPSRLSVSWRRTTPNGRQNRIDGWTN